MNHNIQKMKFGITPDRRIIVCYFSGTGNTQIIAKKIVESFNNKGFTSTLINIENADKISIGNNDVIGIGFPIAVFSTFPIVFNFLEKIGKVNGNYVFAFDTLGGTSLWGIKGKLRTILENKGFQALGFQEFRMPPNIFMKFPEKWCRSRVENSLRQADEFVEKIISGDLNWTRIPILSEVMFGFSRVLFNISKHKWHQKCFKMKVDTSKCNSCGICSTKCPVKNILIEGKAKIGNNCQYCFRCAGVCPSDAISGIASPRDLHYLAEGAEF